jgi:glutamyl endopeptidase
MPVIPEGFRSVPRVPSDLEMSLMPRRRRPRKRVPAAEMETGENPQIETLQQLDINPVFINQPNAYSWCCHVLLDMVASDGRQKVGSGWLIGRRTVITAGHCVYDSGWMSRILVTPGGMDSSFIKRIPAVFSDTTHDWIHGASSAIRQAADVGVVRLAEDITAVTGTLPFKVCSQSELTQIPSGRISVAGFPAHSGQFTADTGRLRSFNAAHLFYDIETWKGQSGAPVLYWDENDRPSVIGIHHWDVGNNLNRAIRLTSQAAALLLQWAA